MASDRPVLSNAKWAAVERGCTDLPGLLSVEAARALLLAGVAPVAEVEDVLLSHAAGRVLAERVAATFPLPPFDRSAVDGYV